MNETIVLWTVYRSRSTAFERMMIERGDFDVLHEPFAKDYFFFSGEKKREEWIPKESKLSPEYEFDNIVKDILKRAEKRPVFVKGMALHVVHKMPLTMLKSFSNTFLIRHPKDVILSHYSKVKDFTFKELGYGNLYKLFNHVNQLNGNEKPIVIDADDLVENPEGIVRSYCERLGIPFLPSSLSWELNKLPKSLTWWQEGAWHESLKRSSGFTSKKQYYPTKIEENPRLLDFLKRSLPFYEELYKHRIRP